MKGWYAKIHGGIEGTQLPQDSIECKLVRRPVNRSHHISQERLDLVSCILRRQLGHAASRIRREAEQVSQRGR